MIPTLILAGVVALVLLANRVWGFDVNIPPRYTPRLTNKATYPKVYVHGVTAFAATLGVVALGVPLVAAVIVLALALGPWEWTQRGTIDPYDIAAGLVGIGAAWWLLL